MKSLFLSLCVLIIASCSSSTNIISDELSEANQVKHGAVYISCESPPWAMTLDGLLSCEACAPIPLEINPKGACAQSSLQTNQPEIVFSYSTNSTTKRFHVKSEISDLHLENDQGDLQQELFVADDESFYLVNSTMRIRASLTNTYAGGCFHELIRWTEEQ